MGMARQKTAAFELASADLAKARELLPQQDFEVAMAGCGRLLAASVERKLREVKTSATHNVGSYLGDAPAVYGALGAARSD